MSDDMRREVLLREINQGALAGMGSEITEQAADLILAAVDRYDAHALAKAYGELMLAALAAVRCVPKEIVRNGCVEYDGRQVSERLRASVLAIHDLLPEHLRPSVPQEGEKP